MQSSKMPHTRHNSSPDLITDNVKLLRIMQKKRLQLNSVCYIPLVDVFEVVRRQEMGRVKVLVTDFHKGFHREILKVLKLVEICVMQRDF